MDNLPKGGMGTVPKVVQENIRWLRSGTASQPLPPSQSEGALGLLELRFAKESMQTLDQALAELVRSQIVTLEDALAKNSNPERINKLLQCPSGNVSTPKVVV